MGRYIDDRPVDERLKVRTYDKVTSWLISLLILLGAADGLMFLLWISPLLTWEATVADTMIEIEYLGRGDHAEGYARDKEPPGAEELEEFMEPEVEMLLEAVTDVVSSTAAAYDSLSNNATAKAVGTGQGDNRPPGPLGDGVPVIPPWERWELKYVTTTVDAYAEQLDQFKIELGAIGGGYPQVDYAGNFTKGIKKYKGKGSAEKRIYFTSAEGNLERYERQLLARAGIPTSGRIVVQFIPKELEQRLLNLELRYATKKDDVSKMTKEEYIPVFLKIAKTIFSVRRARGGKYEFYVTGQRYRDPPKY
ncbi:MAG TPA: hypothetical protein ENJ50_01740 [Planctomycetaceae bacterium]|nr:hypothetical protein [Planctomycetaceae bacterium]